MSLVKAEVLLSTCNDERYPASAILDGKPNTFFVSTGNFPQEIIVGIRAGAANLSRVSLSSSGIKKIRLEKCSDVAPSKFEAIVECEISHRDSSRQIEQFQLNKATAGANTHFLKLLILSGYDDFVAIYDLAIEGDEIAS